LPSFCAFYWRNTSTLLDWMLARWIEKYYNKDETFKRFSLYIFYSTVTLLILFLLQLVIWTPHQPAPNPRRKSSSFYRYPKFSLQNAFSVSVTLLWYVITFLICTIGKIYLQDHTCAIHPNSISGHYTFHFYYLFALPHLYFSIAYNEFTAAKEAIKNPKKEERIEKQMNTRETRAVREYKAWITRDLILLITYIIFAVTTFITLSRTYIFGFHTVRQILYGCILATVSLYIAISAQALALQDRTGPMKLTTIVTVLLVILTYLCKYYFIFPLSNLEIYTCALTWLILVFYSWHKYNKETQKKKNKTI